MVVLASWINRQQADVIDYLRTENQVLKEKLGPQRILLSDDQRRRLAVKGKVLGRRRVEGIGTLFATAKPQFERPSRAIFRFPRI